MAFKRLLSKVDFVIVSGAAHVALRSYWHSLRSGRSLRYWSGQEDTGQLRVWRHRRLIIQRTKRRDRIEFSVCGWGPEIGKEIVGIGAISQADAKATAGQLGRTITTKPQQVIDFVASCCILTVTWGGRPRRDKGDDRHIVALPTDGQNGKKAAGIRAGRGGEFPEGLRWFRTRSFRGPEERPVPGQSVVGHGDGHLCIVDDAGHCL